MSLNLKPHDIEIELTNPGPIIHIFPNEVNPHDAVEQLLTGYYLNKNLNNVLKEIEELIKSKEQTDYLIMASAELKRILTKASHEAQTLTFDFLSKQQDFIDKNSPKL